jgi:hypothetical protein
MSLKLDQDKAKQKEIKKQVAQKEDTNKKKILTK